MNWYRVSFRANDWAEISYVNVKAISPDEAERLGRLWLKTYGSQHKIPLDAMVSVHLNVHPSWLKKN
jgi:hypothetical protein